MVFVMRNRTVVMRWGTSVAASALFATLLVAVGIAVRVEASMTRSAGVTDLCSGWSGCNSAGYSDAGYGAVSGRMYWNMYSGHNCTNYVAYRMIKAGMSTTRPWVGGGNASEWGLQMKNITDQVPNVGAVAWWGRYSNGSGSAGHVGYVEKVVSPTEIIISMDSWGGTFHWRRITKDSGRWPTGFIHFVDKTLTPKAAPAITGKPAVGQTLTTSNGTWVGAPTSYTYEWFADGRTTGVRTRTYVPKGADREKKITVKVQAARSGFTPATQVSAPTAAVVPGTFALQATPTVDGTLFVDDVLTAQPGTWSPEPQAMAWRWYADGKRIVNATETLTLTQDLVGREISVVAVARRAGYTAASGPRVVAGKVMVGTIETSRAFAVLGRRTIGETLTVRSGVFTPADATPSYQWLRDGVPIDGAVAPTYRLGDDDVASRISVQVNLTRKNYVPLSSTATTNGPVRSRAWIQVGAASRGGKAIVNVDVTARGMAPVTGRVRIGIGSWMRTVTLVDGKASVKVARTTGVWNVAVRFLGNAIVPTALRTTTVRVR